MSERVVVVVMPFGGDQQRVERRRAILNYKRLEYLLRETCEVKNRCTAVDGQPFIKYGVEVCKAAIDSLPKHGLQQIQSADILVALMAEKPNPNVIYEVAYRATLERKLILVVDSSEALPLYLDSWVRHPWKQEKILARIDSIAEDSSPPLSDFGAPIPDTLKCDIDQYDKELRASLQDALEEFEAGIKPLPSQEVLHLRGVVSDKCATFYPCSIVEVRFARRGQFEDPKCPALVTDYDDGFVRLFAYAGRPAIEADRPLTLDRLLNRIKPFSDARDWEKFTNEQTELTERVVIRHEFARAIVPLRINHSHPRPEFRGGVYLPSVVAHVIEGNVDGPHTMHLLVVYIELPMQGGASNR